MRTGKNFSPPLQIDITAIQEANDEMEEAKLSLERSIFLLFFQMEIQRKSCSQEVDTCCLKV